MEDVIRAMHACLTSGWPLSCVHTDASLAARFTASRKHPDIAIRTTALQIAWLKWSLGTSSRSAGRISDQSSKQPKQISYQPNTGHCQREHMSVISPRDPRQ